MPGVLSRCADFALAATGVWIPLSLLASIPWMQRQLLYFHWLTLGWGIDIDKPETCGFLKGQVAPFRVKTEDDVSLYAWLIAPVAVYARNVEAFRTELAPIGTPIRQRHVFRCLSEDPEARLIVYFHGNAGTLAQERRTQEYRVMASGLPEKLFILSFDYRGYGKSSGVPSEQGCTLDAITMIRWAMKEANIPSHRIVLHAQSLGTAIVTAAAHHFINLKPKIEFAGLLLSAGFTDASAAFQGFGLQIGVRPLGGLRYMPPLQRWFGRQLRDKWQTKDRLVDYIRSSSRVRLTLMHAKSDGLMPWQHTEQLFGAVLLDLDPDGMQREQRLHSIDLGEGGYVETWNYEDKIITKEIVEHGGHDTIMLWSPIALAILRTLELQNSTLEDDTHMAGVNGSA